MVQEPNPCRDFDDLWALRGDIETEGDDDIGLSVFFGCKGSRSRANRFEGSGG